MGSSSPRRCLQLWRPQAGSRSAREPPTCTEPPWALEATFQQVVRRARGSPAPARCAGWSHRQIKDSRAHARNRLLGAALALGAASAAPACGATASSAFRRTRRGWAPRTTSGPDGSCGAVPNGMNCVSKCGSDLFWAPTCGTAGWSCPDEAPVDVRSCGVPYCPGPPMPCCNDAGARFLVRLRGWRGVVLRRRRNPVPVNAGATRRAVSPPSRARLDRKSIRSIFVSRPAPGAPRRSRWRPRRARTRPAAVGAVVHRRRWTRAAP